MGNSSALPGHENQLLMVLPKAARTDITTATVVLAFTGRTWFGLVPLYCWLRATWETRAISFSRLFFSSVGGGCRAFHLNPADGVP